MQHTLVTPKSVLFPGEDSIRRMSSVSAAYSSLRRCANVSVPPIILVKSRKKELVNLFAKRIEEYPFKYQSFSQYSKMLSPPEFNSHYRRLCDLVVGTSFYLLDGSHRSIAAHLAGVKIPALVLTSSADLSELEEKERIGRIPPFPHNALTIEQLAEEFERYTFGTGLENTPPIVWTCASRTQQLIRENAVSDRLFPEYFVRKPRVVKEP